MPLDCPHMTVLEGAGSPGDPFVRCAWVDKVAPWGVMFRRAVCLKCSGKRSDPVVRAFVRRTLLNRIVLDGTDHKITQHGTAARAAKLLKKEGFDSDVTLATVQQGLLAAVHARTMTAADATRIATELGIDNTEV